ncbi:hypothetical protein IWQ62_001998 [Dispira parvispora]|uniref:Ricin B lectin domain-containing protein n=1 Tax=Dispira parvispora TaxID=1520584 RepID=A0A9W8E7Y7_9FUNG|nr:hypothetical protein IWQ62_001998 [Dispira parvispora]
MRWYLAPLIVLCGWCNGTTPEFEVDLAAYGPPAHKLITGDNLCLTVENGVQAASTKLLLERCDRRHVPQQIYQSVDCPDCAEGAPVMFQINSRCVEVKKTRTFPNPQYVVIINECTQSPDQLFLWIEDQDNNQRLKNVKTKDCLQGNAEDGTITLADCDSPNPGLVWSKQYLTAVPCDDTTWENFISGDQSLGDLMRDLNMDVEAYLRPVKSKGIPSLSTTDKAILEYCDIDIQEYFDNVENWNRNMFVKLGQYPAIYGHQVGVVAEETVYMFIQSRSSYRLWKSVKPMAEDFVDQFSFYLVAMYPQFTWLIGIGREVIKDTLNRTVDPSPEKKFSWRDEVQKLFDHSLDLIWEMHVRIINNVDHQEYERYAETYVDKTLQEIFGEEKKVRNDIIVMISKRITSSPDMRNECCVLEFPTRWGRGVDYYNETSNDFYRVMLPGKSREKLEKITNITEIAIGENSWSLERVKVSTGWSTCSLRL